ncbi:MAG: DUF192 domain-containing protein [Candidatus Bathyarchaeia archaeon]|jgi:uncharacterized membrane protein (UPF0127 family)
MMKFRVFMILITFFVLLSTQVSISMLAHGESQLYHVNGSMTTVSTTAAAGTNSTNSAHIMIAGVILTVELAETATAQEKGLSGRPYLPSNEGMLFVFDHPSYWSFWMTDMKFPLDIIWFNSTRQVVFSEPNLPPCTPQNCPVVTPTSKAMYVLEVNAGFMTSHQIRMGTSFIFLGH